MRIPGPALFLPLFLAGCALPPVVSVASLFAGGVSYATTGKGATDHAISAIAGEDCALHRVVDGEAICDPDGDVLIALTVGDPADENWYLDPETGSIDAGAVARSGTVNELEAAVGESKTFGQTASALPALTPGPVGQGGNLAPLTTAISIAAKPSPRGLFADARPAAKPEIPQLQIQTVSRFAKLTLQDGQLATFAVIGSFQNTGNAQRMAAKHGDGATVQTIVVGGQTTYRVLLDQPLEQARIDGFPDAWPVRLCADDLDVPPCGQLIVSQAGVYFNTIAN